MSDLIDSLIDRRVAIEAIKDLPNCPNGYSDTYDKARIIGVLEGLPTAEKHGQWIEKEVVDQDDIAIDMWQSARCSACGHYHTTPYMYFFVEYNYCPHCGAKMKTEASNAHK